MNEKLWTRAGQLLSEALELPSDQRGAFLDQTCAADQDLRREVEELLDAHEAAAGWLEGEGSLNSPPPPRTGTRIGPWILRGELGEGGMGTVFRAERADGVHDGLAALKLIKPGMDSREVLRRFADERRILASLDHPNIARFIDGGSTDDQRPYFVMELIQGEDLLSWCQSRQATLKVRLKLFLEVCRAVDFAHRRLVVHRDLKRSNVLIEDHGAVKLLDFGIAKLLAPDPSGESTRTGLRPMSPRSSSPEQVRGDVVTTASDVYSLGLLLYELLTDASPYGEHSRSLREMEQAILEHQPAPPSAAARRTNPKMANRLAGDLDAVVLKALEKDPSQRYDSAAGLARDLENVLTARPVSARRRTFLYTLSKALRRHQLPATAIFIALGMVLLFVLQLIGKQRQLDRQHQRAEAISEFLLDTFRVSDPGEARGNSVTARELLDRGAERIRDELETEPEARADLLDTMGRVYQNLGLYNRAAELQTEALKIRRQLYGDLHLEVAGSVNELGSVYYWQGHYEEASEQLRRALEIYRQLEGSDGEHVATVENNLGAVLIDLWQPGEAETLLRHALEVRRRLPGPRPAEIAETLGNLAGLLMRLGQLEESEALRRENVQILTRLHGQDHPQVAIQINNLATTLYHRGDMEEAGKLFSQALELQRRIHGERHLAVSATLNNLAAIRRLQGRLEEAETLQRRALEIDLELYGDEHPNVATHRYNLGRILRAQGQDQAAEDLFRQSLASRGKALGEQHPGTVRVAVGLAILWLDTGRLDQAVEALRPLAEAFRESDPDVWAGAWAEAALGRCLALRHGNEEARRLLNNGQRRLRALLGEEHEVVRQVVDWTSHYNKIAQ